MRDSVLICGVFIGCRIIGVVLIQKEFYEYGSKQAHNQDLMVNVAVFI